MSEDGDETQSTPPRTCGPARHVRPPAVFSEPAIRLQKNSPDETDSSPFASETFPFREGLGHAKTLSELFRWEGGLSIGRQGLESKVELVYVLVI